MTCIIAARTRDGRSMIAADTCIAYALVGSQDKVFRDELQKIYALSNKLVVALATDDVREARMVLLTLRDEHDKLGGLLSSHGAKWEDAEWVRRTLTSLLAKHSVSLRLILILGVASPSGFDLYHWDSRKPDELDQVKAGERRILGSISGHKDLADGIGMAVDSVIGGSGSARQGTEDLGLALASALALRMGMQDFRRAQVGGIFQIAVAEGSTIWLLGSETTVLRPGKQSLRVSLSHSGGAWTQTNLDTKQSIVIGGIDDRSVVFASAPNPFVQD